MPIIYTVLYTYTYVVVTLFNAFFINHVTVLLWGATRHTEFCVVVTAITLLKNVYYSWPPRDYIIIIVVVDARQRNERNARMGTLETGWLRVGALSGSADFTRKLNMRTLRLRGSHFVYKKLVPNKPQNKKNPI
jgi:hypothetical protein